MNFNKAILLAANETKGTEFQKININAESQFDEKWLQNRIFEDITLLNAVDPTFERVALVPLCRELALHDTVRNVFLDILAVTQTGKLVLVECKLWKNPQARREVIAQIIEYASLLRSLSYGDLVAKLKKNIHSGKDDPILFQFQEHNVEFDEARLIDQISYSLHNANFQLVIAGDGIRSDLQNLTRNTNFSGVIGDLCLLEINLYRSDEGSIIMVPNVPVKTETVTKTVLLSPEGAPVTIEDEPEVNEVGVMPARIDEATKTANREFWDQFINSVKFDHPDQSPPKRAGNNWVKVDIPDPFGWITAYRSSKNRIGVFAGVSGSEAEKANQYFMELESQLKTELGENIYFDFDTEKKGWGNGFFISIRQDDIDIYDPKTFETQISWLAKNLNNFVNTLRPLARAFMEDT